MDEMVICKREELYEQIWAEPMRTVARRYGVSDVALAKICRKLRVPLPGRGFWTKKAAGYNVVAPKLPPLKPGQPSQHTIRRRTDWQESIAEDTREQIAAEGQSDARIEVPETIETPHPLVRHSEAMIRRSARPKSTLDVGQHHCLDIRVGEQTVDRAIRIADALIKALEARGLPVDITAPETTKPTSGWERPKTIPSRTRVLIHDEHVEFRIEEAHDTVRIDITKDAHYGTPRYVWRPDRERRFNGRLIFRITNLPYARGVQHSWGDGKVQRVETQLNNIVRGLIVAADALRADRIERERRHREYEEEQSRRAVLELQREEEARRVADLKDRMAAWRQARAVLEFVAAVEQDAEERLGGVSPDSTIAQWIDWARGRADRLATHAVRTIGRM